MMARQRQKQLIMLWGAYGGIDVITTRTLRSDLSPLRQALRGIVAIVCVRDSPSPRAKVDNVGTNYDCN